MRKLKFLVSLMTNDNDYQIEQARVRRGVGPQVGS